MKNIIVFIFYLYIFNLFFYENKSEKKNLLYKLVRKLRINVFLDGIFKIIM